MGKKLEHKYIIDSSGELLGVVLEPKKYLMILNALEELDDIRVYDKTKRNVSTPVDFEQAIALIGKERRSDVYKRYTGN